MTSEEYYNWLEKFEPKKTTDDCYTPPKVYDIVLDYVNKEVISLDGLNVVRPFYPNGDYQKDVQSYDDNTIVIDNPPFSIISEICKFYQENKIKFFLFAPALTIFSTMYKTNGLTAIIAPQDIIYANGAKVRTSFITNCMPNVQAKTAPNLYNALKTLCEPNKKAMPKYKYPDNVLTVSKLNELCRQGVEFKVHTQQSIKIKGLDKQKQHGKSIFGYGLLVCNDTAKVLQAKKQPEVFNWQLSEREEMLVKQLSESKDETQN